MLVLTMTKMNCISNELAEMTDIKLVLVLLVQIAAFCVCDK